MLGLLAGLIRGHRARLLIFALLAGLCVAAAAAIPAWSGAAATGTTVSALGDTAPGDRSARLGGVLRPDPLALAASATVAADLLPGARFTRYAAVGATVTGAGPDGPETFRLHHLDGACARLVLDGACADGPGEIMMSAETAARFGVAAGDRIGLQGAPGAAVPFTVTGVFRPAEVDDEFWTVRTAPGLTPDRGALLGDRGGFEPLGVPATDVTYDYVLRTDVPLDVPAIRADLAGLTPQRLDDLILNTRLPVLLDGLRGNEDALFRGATVTAAQLALLGGFVLLLAAAQLAAERRDEAALAALRGAPAGTRSLVAVTPGLLAVLIAAPAGLAAGYGAAALAARAEFSAVPPPEPSLAWAGVAALGCVAVVLIAAVVHRPRGPVLEGLRRTPSRLRVQPLDAVTLVVLALAAAAWFEIDSAGAPAAEGVALLGPALFALGGGLLAARLVPPLAARVATHRLRTGRLGSGLAALQLARRPGGHRVITLFAAAIALLVQAVAAADLGVRAAGERARWEVGADRVLAVRSTGPQALRDAVHRADPDGRWAMPVLRARHGGAPLLAVEPERAVAVMARPRGLDPGRLDALPGLLRADTNPVVTVDGGTLVLDVEVDELSTADDLAVHLVDPAGTPVTVSLPLPLTPGRTTVRAPVEGCAAGCRLVYLGFVPGPAGLRLLELRQEGPDRTVLTGAELGAPGRWRPGFNLGAALLSMRQDGPWLAARFEGTSPRDSPIEVRVRQADVPVPVPVVVAAAEAGVQADGIREATGFDLSTWPVTMTGGLPSVPGLGHNGLLIDYEYAVRLLEGPALNATYEVWLAPDAPAGVRDDLRAAGLTVVGETTIDARAAELRAQGPGQAARLHLAAALFGMVLALAGIVLVGTVERSRRAADLGALRAQGLSASAAGTASRWDRVVLVLSGVTAGVLLGRLSWAVHDGLLPVFADGAAPSVPVQPYWAAAAVAVATAALLTAALRRDSRPDRASPARGRASRAGDRP
ncbi:FtsX-like permease family protein [Catenuloplanes atrovinosus]|uniref:FtsX-like permease family protein n=1 Tax=Catenuloplanes atrovinosus TaxID=137266 RepID=A0AAE4CGW1_9ACTN|nr:FtsX-like permease family protein [Catenuloplanes atrovinosus]MDR7281130.1 hypothetical protein [Catenuloplanes atrovinosus]